jgi:hypothetical protein
MGCGSAPPPGGGEQTVLFNLATTTTVALGVAALYVALFALTLVGAGLVLDPDVLADALDHEVDVGDYVRLAWFVSSLATVGGALGAGLESDLAVREAAYGYRSTERKVPSEQSEVRQRQRAGTPARDLQQVPDGGPGVRRVRDSSRRGDGAADDAKRGGE